MAEKRNCGSYWCQGCLVSERTKNFLLFSTQMGEGDLLTLGPLTAVTQSPERTPHGV